MGQLDVGQRRWGGFFARERMVQTGDQQSVFYRVQTLRAFRMTSPHLMQAAI
jgi:hypothetical protein